MTFPRSLAIAASLCLSGCASHKIHIDQYQGATSQVGHGGTVNRFDGVDFWKSGTPPRKFIVVGIIDDEFTWHPDERDMRDWAKAVKAFGGNAVVMPDYQTRERPVAQVVRYL